MDKNQKGKGPKITRQTNIVESLRDVGDSVGKSIKSDLLKPASEDFFKQLFGPMVPEKKYSGEIGPGESIELNEVFSGKREEVEKTKKQLAMERKLRQEEKSRMERKSNDLKLQLHAITQEVITLAASTQNLAQEVKIATLQAPVNPGIYHIVFFEKLLEFIKSFNKKINDASIWLHASNSRAMKKNYWGLYKQHGSKFLLSPDHYLQRSAG